MDTTTTGQMNRNCVVRAHGAGLTSNLNKILVCLRFYDVCFVDWSKAAENDPAFKYGGSFYGDCFHRLFYHPTPRPNEPYDVISGEWPTYEITDACASVLYRHAEWNWRERYNNAWKRLTCVVDPIPVGPNTIGVLIRSDAIAGEQMFGRNQTLQEYAEAIDKEMDNESAIFVVSSDQESVAWMQNRYPGKVYFSSGIKRAARRSDPEQHLHVVQTAADAIDVMREVLTLSRCRTLVSGVSNMATLPLIISPSLKHIYLR